MENEKIMETRNPRIAKKYRIPLALLLISSVIVGAVAVALFTQTYTYTAPTKASVTGLATLDFGALTVAGTKTFTGALVIGAGTTSSITFAFVSPTLTWDTVFSGISIAVRQGTTSVACIASGMGTCGTVTSAFTPTASTTYDYLATFTPQLVVPAGVTLQTTWAVTPVTVGQTAVNLGTAANFAVLAGSTVTNTGITTISGSLGVSPGTAITGLPGIVPATPAVSATAEADLVTAFIAANALTLPITVAGDLGGQTLVPGLYKSTSSIGITGALTLDAQGNANAVFVFQIGSTLVTATNSQVILTGGAQAKNVFWAVGSSATLGTNSVFKGTIMAQASITITTGATLDGRALAITGAVTLDTNTITKPL